MKERLRQLQERGEDDLLILLDWAEALKVDDNILEAADINVLNIYISK